MTFHLIDKIPCCDKVKCFNEYNDFYTKFPVANLLINPEEVCTAKMEANGYNNTFECCTIIKLFLDYVPKELLNFKTGIHYVYLLTDSDKNQFKVTIDQINTTDVFIKVNKYLYDFSLLKLGEIELTCILDYDKLPEMDKLKQVGYEIFPTFHETRMDVIKKDENDLHLKFSGGFSPLVTDIKMFGIFKEDIQMENNTNPYKYFTRDGFVGGVEFQTIDNYFIVKISHNYLSFDLIGWYQGISREEYERLNADPNNTIIEKHINEYKIYCSNISFDFEKATKE